MPKARVGFPVISSARSSHRHIASETILLRRQVKASNGSFLGGLLLARKRGSVAFLGRGLWGRKYAARVHDRCTCSRRRGEGLCCCSKATLIAVGSPASVADRRPPGPHSQHSSTPAVVQRTSLHEAKCLRQHPARRCSSLKLSPRISSSFLLPKPRGAAGGGVASLSRRTLPI